MHRLHPAVSCEYDEHILIWSLPSFHYSELEDLLEALRRVQSCLVDTQSQADVALVLGMLHKEDFQSAFTIHSAVTQQMQPRGSPPLPLTAQAQGLCLEVE